MKTVLVVFAIAAIVLALSFCGIGIKMFLKKMENSNAAVQMLTLTQAIEAIAFAENKTYSKIIAIHITNTLLWK